MTTDSPNVSTVLDHSATYPQTLHGMRWASRAWSKPAFVRDQWHCVAGAEAVAEWVTTTFTPSETYTQDKDYSFAVTHGECELKITLHQTALNTTIGVEGAGPTEDAINTVISVMVESFPRLALENKEDEVHVRFWYHTNRNGAQSEDRAISAPSWESIKDNYTADVRDEIEHMMQLTPETLPTGRLVLWTGMPGTGKTYAIRAILRQWAKWCTAEFIADPEKFLSEAEYLMDVLLSEPDRDREKYNPVSGEYEAVRSERWKLVICEDAGELISKDAKSRVGQGLSRLLNVTEGMLGQGLNVIILITTNEDLDGLHEAVARDGRCMARTKFLPLAKDEVEHWFTMQGLKTPDGVNVPAAFGIPSDRQGATLAHLFALRDEAQALPQPEPVPA